MTTSFATVEQATKGDSVSDYRSVLTGGQIPGWTPDVAVVLWKRMLGILGDVNAIKQCNVHEKVMGHLLDLQETLFKVSNITVFRVHRIALVLATDMKLV